MLLQLSQFFEACNQQGAEKRSMVVLVLADSITSVFVSSDS